MKSMHQEIYQRNKNYVVLNHDYVMVHFTELDTDILKYITYRKRAGRGVNFSMNEVILMADTETSKKKLNEVYDNHVCAWTISARAYDMNLFTVYGEKPSDLIQTMIKIHDSMSGAKTIFFFHNLAYDWIFIRKFMFHQIGYPERQLNTKSHYPISIEFQNGIILRDSLILAQRSLDKWGNDMDVLHKKAVGKWDYDKVRNQVLSDGFTKDELEYIEHDTLCGIECIDTLMQSLDKNILTIPYTATGIVREQVRKLAKKNRGHDRFLRQALTYDQNKVMQCVFHGGYTHGNRHLIDTVIDWAMVECYDFASSYPNVMLCEMYPGERFTLVGYDMSAAQIIANKEEYAFYFKFCATNIQLKDYFEPMPSLQLSKCISVVNPILDNGRILSADYVEIYLNEIDLDIIESMYKHESHVCTECHFSHKRYLPRWITDYIFSLFEQKTKLKGSPDKVAYNLAKSKLNSVYGLTVQSAVKGDIDEVYDSGEYIQRIYPTDEGYDDYMRDKYQKHLDNYNTVLPYQWGCWVTSYAMHNLFEMAKSCCGNFIYSDTDSVYGYDWDKDALNAYNEKCKDKLRKNGYGCVYHNGREYWLGIAEFDGEYSEFKVLGAKRYCGRSTKDGQLHITVAGVPKIGAKCLHDDINNFTRGFVFPGSKTNKKTHTYIYVDDIYIDENGNETGDSIDLSPCDYMLDMVECMDWSDIFEQEEVNIQVYE